jgi:hypothetical protein
MFTHRVRIQIIAKQTVGSPSQLNEKGPHYTVFGTDKAVLLAVRALRLSHKKITRSGNARVMRTIEGRQVLS